VGRRLRLARCWARLQEASGEGAATVREFGRGGHGCRALARAQARGRSERGDGKRRGSEREWRGSLWRPPRRAQGHGCTRHGGGGAARVAPLRHSTERLAGDGVGWLDRVIGLVLVRTKSWALKQVCCPHDDLQISLTDHSHLSNGLAVN